MRLLHRVYLTLGLLVSAIFLIDLPVFGAIVNVPQDYATLRMAVDSVNPGDTIVLDSGNYSGNGFANITISKSVYIQSRYGASQTVIQNAWNAVSVPDVFTGNVTIVGITFRTIEVAVDFQGDSYLVIRKCIFEGDGYGVYFQPPLWADGLIDSCRFVNNGVGLYTYVESNVNVQHCLFMGNNKAIEFDHTFIVDVYDNIFVSNQYALYFNGGDGPISRNVIWRNQYCVYTYPYAPWHPYSELDFGCNDVFGNGVSYPPESDLTGTFGNISEDPQFCDTTLANLSVSSFSPLLAANNSCHVNIGGVSAVGCYCGDVDKSGGLDIADLTLLIGYLYLGEPAPSPIEAGRIDGDASVDISDVTYLIAYLFLSGPKPICS